MVDRSGADAVALSGLSGRPVHGGQSWREVDREQGDRSLVRVSRSYRGGRLLDGSSGSEVEEMTGMPTVLKVVGVAFRALAFV